MTSPLDTLRERLLAVRSGFVDAPPEAHVMGMAATAAADVCLAVCDTFAKEWRCDECTGREEGSHYCLVLSIPTPDAFYCKDWEARP